MAKDKTVAKTESSKSKDDVMVTNAASVDLAKFLPEGFSLDDFEKVGGLRPICGPELNAESPVVGWIVAHLPMPPRKDKSEWSALLVRLMSTAQAEAGDEIITVQAGNDVLIPVNGSLRNNSDLMNVAVDTRKVTAGIFRVVGQIDTGKVSKMWDYEVQLAMKKQIPRDGAFALYNRPVVVLGTEHIARGEVIGKNGEPARLVG